MSDQTKATPRPWRIHDDPDQALAIETADGEHITYVARSRYLDERADPAALANAHLIVRAVNSHEKLLEAARAALSALMDEDDDSARTEGQRFHELTMQLSDAIEAAEGGAP